ncbi:Galactose-binding protein isoform 1 [Hibiscus syriacus]|uniref:Galactose-binding protein isoform 1 n=1 Tax=Hibiscus syriacus TaxID=106335 RepID=A0A6A2WB88_HIBSY|nr:Galactose-binding protein isoform 1 [Hibiscus syriacus]
MTRLLGSAQYRLTREEMDDEAHAPVGVRSLAATTVKLLALWSPPALFGEMMISGGRVMRLTDMLNITYSSSARKSSGWAISEGAAPTRFLCLWLLFCGDFSLFSLWLCHGDGHSLVLDVLFIWILYVHLSSVQITLCLIEGAIRPRAKNKECWHGSISVVPLSHAVLPLYAKYCYHFWFSSFRPQCFELLTPFKGGSVVLGLSTWVDARMGHYEHSDSPGQCLAGGSGSFSLMMCFCTNVAEITDLHDDSPANDEASKNHVSTNEELNAGNFVAEIKSENTSPKSDRLSHAVPLGLDEFKSRAFISKSRSDTAQAGVIHRGFAVVRVTCDGRNSVRDDRNSARDCRNHDVWTTLGNFTAANVKIAQRFVLQEPKWVRYMKLNLLSHYGSEFYCTLSVIEVYGVDVVERMLEDLIFVQDNLFAPEDGVRDQKQTPSQVESSHRDDIHQSSHKEMGSEPSVVNSNVQLDATSNVAPNPVEEIRLQQVCRVPGDCSKILMQKVRALALSLSVLEPYLEESNSNYNNIFKEFDQEIGEKDKLLDKIKENINDLLDSQNIVPKDVADIASWKSLAKTNLMCWPISGSSLPNGDELHARKGWVGTLKLDDPFVRVFIPSATNKPKYKTSTFAFVQFSNENSRKRSADIGKTQMEANKSKKDGKRRFEEDVKSRISLRDDRTYKESFLERLAGSSRKFICIPEETRNREDFSFVKLLVRVTSLFYVPKMINVGEDLERASEGWFSEDASLEEDEGSRLALAAVGIEQSTKEALLKVDTWLEQGETCGLKGDRGGQSLLSQFEEYSGPRFYTSSPSNDNWEPNSPIQRLKIDGPLIYKAQQSFELIPVCAKRPSVGCRTGIVSGKDNRRNRRTLIRDTLDMGYVVSPAEGSDGGLMSWDDSISEVKEHFVKTTQLLLPKSILDHNAIFLGTMASTGEGVVEIVQNRGADLVPKRKIQMGHQILECPFIANEGIGYWRKKGLKGGVFKVDFRKVYNTIDWPILFKVMEKKGFGVKWRN